MKLTILVFSLFIHTLSLTSQEIDESWFLHPDVIMAQVNTFNPDESRIKISEFGVDQIWDFSFQSSNGLVDTTWFLDPSDMVFGEYFPEATIGRRNVNPFYDWEWFYSIESDTIYDLGFSYIRHVGNSLDTFIGVGTGSDIFMVNGFGLMDTLWNSDLQVTNVQFHGTGTVITSSRDTFENCILFKTEFPQFQNIEYKWYQDDLTKEVAVYVPSESSNPDAALTWLVDYQYDTGPSSIRIQVERKNELEVFVFDNRLMVRNLGKHRAIQIQYFDLSGQLISREEEVIYPGENYFNYSNEPGLSSMICLVIDKTTGQFTTKKIIR